MYTPICNPVKYRKDIVNLPLIIRLAIRVELIMVKIL